MMDPLPCVEPHYNGLDIHFLSNLLYSEDPHAVVDPLYSNQKPKSK